ncbi:MAG: hypothetical protein ABSG95_03720 [Solirubrobacteraceae bacterium]
MRNGTAAKLRGPLPGELLEETGGPEAPQLLAGFARLSPSPTTHRAS